MLARATLQTGLAALTAVLALGGFSGAAHAEGPLRDLLFPKRGETERRPTPPPVARYESSEGANFVLDRSGGVVLMKFEDSQEVWALTPTAGPRGDVIYRNDLGQPVLRSTRLGGLTLFGRGSPGGAPAAFSGAAGALRAQALTAAALFRRLAQCSLKASRTARHLIVFQAKDVTPGSEAVYADAALNAAMAVDQMARTPKGRAKLEKLTKVHLAQGGKAEVRFDGATMMVTVNAKQGLAGRPSSGRIVLAALK